MGFKNFLENPLGTIESWGEDIVSRGKHFVSDLSHGNVGGALGDLAALATNLTPVGAAMNAFTGGALSDGVFKTVDGVTHGDFKEVAAGLVEGLFASNPSLALVNDVLKNKPLKWADDTLGVKPRDNISQDVRWPAAAPRKCSPTDDTLSSYERVGRALTALSNQHSSGGPVVRLPPSASSFLLVLSQKQYDQLPNPRETQYSTTFSPPAQTPSLWSIDDTLQVAGMLAFGLPEGGAVLSGAINALELLRRNIENQTPKVDPMMAYLERSFSALQQFVDQELKDQTISQAVTFFRAKQEAVFQPFVEAMKGNTVPSKDILQSCKDMLEKGEDALSPLMYDYRTVGNLAVPPTVAEYAFRAWIDCANTFLFCMKAGAILSAVQDEDWTDLSVALKKTPLTARIASTPDAYRYFQKINATLGTSTSPFRRHLQLVLVSMHQKLAKRLGMLTPSTGDANLLRYRSGWTVAVDAGLTPASGGGVDDFIVSHINWPRESTEATDHLVRGATTDSPPKAVWQRAGAYAVGDKDTLTKNTYAYLAMVANHYLDAYNYDVGTSEAPSSMLSLAVSVAEKWWGDDNSLWQSLTRTLATYQLQAQTRGGVMPFWDALKVPHKEDVHALLTAYLHTAQNARAQGAAGLSQAASTARTNARNIASQYAWGG